MRASHDAWFDFRYQGDYPEMYDLYRARCRTSGRRYAARLVHQRRPRNPERPVFPIALVPMEGLAAHGIRLNPDEQMRFVHDFSSWLLSQFMHGEQGALFASAQVTESVRWSTASSTARRRSWTRRATSRCSCATSRASSASSTR